MADLYAILPGSDAAQGRRRGGWQQGLEPDAHGAELACRCLLPSCCRRLGASAPAAGKRTSVARERWPRASLNLKPRPAMDLVRARRPLLVSVRSGAAVSMPGMMETVLDVGLNAETVEALIRLTGNPRLAWDSYRRLVQGYAEVVANLPTAPFDALVARRLERAEADERART